MRKYGGSRACGMCGNGGAAGLLQGCPLWEVPFARADDRIGPPRGLVVGCRLCAVSRSRRRGRAGVFARRLGFAAAQGFRDDASIVPYEAQDKALPGVTGYLWGKAAMHPSVCAFRRSHRPVCGARIARRALKHACALRPLQYREAVKTGAVSEWRSYAFYRRTGDNKRSDGRLPHEKQLSPPQAALDSAAPCRGGCQTAAPQKSPL